uniref:DENN domaincontaining protein 5Blike [Apis florea] n=1 Tax=Lepeophtheirus salmonis TaxID=72036 RepID=A0A0K2V7U8_LEPSM
METLVRYFLVSGLENNADLEWMESSYSQRLLNPLERSYKPRILRHYPSEIESWSGLNLGALSNLTLPQGLKFCTERELLSYKPSFHPFVLTREDGSKLQGFSLAYYECVTDTSICQALQTLQHMHSTEMAGESSCSNSRRTAERPKSARVTSERSRSLPRHYNQRFRSSSTVDLSGAFYDSSKDNLYVTKSLAFISSQPLVSIAQQVLYSIYKYINTVDYDISVLEGFLYNLLFDIPLPSPGHAVRFWSLGEVITMSLPREPDELPLFDYNLFDFFDILGIENAIKLWICVLLEHQTVVFSSDFDKLMLVCESITSLCYPFKWPHVYVPILPPSLENFLDAPVPYIMGLLRRTHDYELYKRSGTVAILDIDSGELELPEELPQFPCESELLHEIKEIIVEYGGSEGIDLLKEHAKELAETVPNMESFNKKRDNENEMDESLGQLEKMINKFENMSSHCGSSRSIKKSNKSISNAHTDKLKLNNALREVFVNRFVQIFISYENFVITQSEMELAQNQYSSQNFDKISFLSDQVASHFPFLSSFMETQIFYNFIEEMSNNSKKSSFSSRMKKMKTKFTECIVRTLSYEKCECINESQKKLMSRLRKVELSVSPPKTFKPNVLNYRNFENSNKNFNNNYNNNSRLNNVVGVFPLFESDHFARNNGKSNHSAVIFRGISSQISTEISATGVQNVPEILNSSPAAIAEMNWSFVQQLLEECKQKTRRILLEKLGSEAVEWGHAGTLDNFHTEENMLVAGLCDLLERIWSHGLTHRQKKSSLWHFLCKRNDSNLSKRNQLGSQAYCVSLMKSKPYVLPDHARPVQVISITSMDNNILAMMHNVSTIHEIKTEIGYARAWIRLTLEQKKLSQFLQILLSDHSLLQKLYKRYAFLRNEDEREQAIHYTQTLNTVDFSCFTNAYLKSSLLYQVLIFPSQKTQALSTANLWIHIVGSLGETSKIVVPRGNIHFAFWATNVGVITSLRLGHDNVGSSWLVEHVLVKNEFTGQLYKFSCGRWLGNSIDDGSIERYMVGYSVNQDMNRLIQTCAHPPKFSCPISNYKSNDSDTEIVEIQTMLGDSINRIIKFYHKSLNEKISYAHLMCGQSGLVQALICVFSFGYKSARLFGKNLSVWDFFLKVTMDFNQSLAHLQSSPYNSPKRNVPGSSATLESPRRLRNNILDSPKVGGGGTPTGTLSRVNQFRRMYTKLITRIETTCTRLGKDDKFQLFVCLAVHDRLLGKIITDLTKAIAAQQLYDEVSFLRDTSLTSFLSHILETLEEISIPVDPALTKTLEQHNSFI